MDHTLPLAASPSSHGLHRSSASLSSLPRGTEATQSSAVPSATRKIRVTKRPNGVHDSPGVGSAFAVGQLASSARRPQSPSTTFPSASTPPRQGNRVFYDDVGPPSSSRSRSLKVKKPSLLSAVLLKLINALIRRDAYGFFCQPVDEQAVLGYRTVIRQPMDLGTMKDKVEKGRYGTLRHFGDDFNLVISNAKAFNPPDSIFHQQAVKLEAWGTKALAREEEKGLLLPGEEQESADSDVGFATSTSAKKLSVRLKRPASDLQASQITKKPRPSSTGKERSISRPAVPSTLRQSPTLATTFSESPNNEGEDSYSRRPSTTREALSRFEDEEDAFIGRGKVKLEREESLRGIETGDSEGDEEEGNDADDDDDDSHRSSHRGGSASVVPSGRESATPGPGGSARRRPVLPNRRYYPRKNAPARPEETAVAAIHRVLTEAKASGIVMHINEAALYARQATREQALEKPLPYCADGSLDIDTMRYSDRVDLYTSRGFSVDPAYNDPVPGFVLPELSAVYPLHPDAQQFSAQLARTAPRDALFAASSIDSASLEDRSSHYEHAFPAGHTRVPTTLPTAPVLMTKDEGLLSEGVSLFPNRWPNPQQADLKDYKVPDVLDARALPSARIDPSIIQLRTFGGGPTTQKSRNKDAEREAEGVSNLPDWTYPHAYYSRLWDGLSDLAVWKSVESTIMKFGPNGGIRGSDGELSSYEGWEKTKLRRIKEMVKWEEREAICRAAGSSSAESQVFPPLLDDESEMGILSKISAMADEGRALPNTEKARQHLESLDFYRMVLWSSKPDGVGSTSGVNGDAWARSVETFVEGAVKAVSDSDRGPRIHGIGDHKHDFNRDEEKTSTPRSPASKTINALKHREGEPNEDASRDTCATESPPASRPSLTLAERTLEAITLGSILGMTLYDYVRDSVVVPASAQGGLGVAIKAGSWMKSLHDMSRTRADIKFGTGTEMPESDQESDPLVNLLAPDDPLWSQLSLIIGPNSVSISPLTNLLSSLTSSDFAYLLISTPRLWGRSHFLRILLDKPVLLDTLILKKMDEWTEVAKGKKVSAASHEGRRLLPEAMVACSMAPEDVIRFGDSQWTRARMANALNQYSRLLLWLDHQKEISRRPVGKSKTDGEGEDGEVNGEVVERLEEEVRLALLSLARMAPGNHVKMLVN